MGQASQPVNECAGVFVRATANKSWNFVYRRKLPHWRQDQVTYSVTWRLARGREPDGSGRELVVAAMKSFDGQRYQLAAYVVMDDHVHALLTPLAGYELKAILHSWEVVHRPSDATRALALWARLAG